MTTEHCYWFGCFHELSTTGTKFFGFSEFLAGLALMVLVWTIADVRYRFRIKVAPLPLQGITFTVICAIGILTLVTDLWRAEGWLVPSGGFMTPAIWQAVLGLFFLIAFLAWAWFAFIRPPMYGSSNAKRYVRELYGIVIKGDPVELAVIADEFSHSAKSLIEHAPTQAEYENDGKISITGSISKLPNVSAYAHDMLLLIADKRLCRVIVESSPGTVLAIFEEVSIHKKFDIAIQTFAKNIVSAAIANENSFLYHEVEGYESGLIGYLKPLSQAIFSNYEMVEKIGTLLDTDYLETQKWTAAQWEAYCRTVLLAFRSYVNHGLPNHSITLYRAKGCIERAVTNLYSINAIESALNGNECAKLQIVVEYIQNAIEILDPIPLPKFFVFRNRKENRFDNVYDHLAGMIFQVIVAASGVRSPPTLSWWVQHNIIWREFFNFRALHGTAGQIVKHKVRRLLFNELIQMKELPNFQGARVLSYCLNVMGLSETYQKHDRDSQALKKLVLSWVKKYYMWLYAHNPSIANDCLPDRITYDPEKSRLVMTYPVNGLRRDPQYVYLDLDTFS